MSNEVDIRDADGDRVPVASTTITSRNGVATTTAQEAQLLSLGVVDGAGDIADVDATNPYPVKPTTSGDVATTLTELRKTSSLPGVPARLVTTVTPCSWVTVQALQTNVSPIAVGNAPVAAAGSEVGLILQPGQSVTIPIDDAHKINFDVNTAGDGVTAMIGAT
jgi:hypothetical protein